MYPGQRARHAPLYVSHRVTLVCPVRLLLFLNFDLCSGALGAGLKDASAAEIFSAEEFRRLTENDAYPELS